MAQTSFETGTSRSRALRFADAPHWLSFRPGGVLISEVDRIFIGSDLVRSFIFLLFEQTGLLIGNYSSLVGKVKTRIFAFDIGVVINIFHRNSGRFSEIIQSNLAKWHASGDGNLSNVTRSPT